ncbi:MAG: protein translocase subunit SecF [Acidimicrobiales bacterium]|nr:protein translocase subunit SecF [Acidimicrobiales bacterium]MCB1258822.1 protein translocase subunit SecF [Acidimicrobiales bacterium]
MSAVGRLLRGQSEIDFVPWWKRGLILSGILIVLSVVALFTRGLNLGIEFSGGISWEVKAPGVTVEQTREALAPFGLEFAKIQIVGSDTLRVQASTEAQDEQDAVRATLAELGNTTPEEVNVSSVGPSWGSEITAAAVRALVLFLLAVFGWLALRLEWKMAAGAIAAVVHDVIVSVGVYAAFQFEVTPPTVIAFLTILGFSIYDTVVVFDKVQENQGRTGLASRMTYTDMTSLSMNQVLLRSINTSVTSLLPVLCILVVGSGILGAVTLQEFAIALAIGLLAGTYSSIFVATPIVVWLKEREPRNRQLRVRLEATAHRAGSTAPGAAGDAAGTEANGDDAGTEASGSGTGSRLSAARAAAPAPSGAIPPRPRKKGKKR